MEEVRKQMEDSNQSNDCLKVKLETKLTNAQKNRELMVKEIQERLKEHVSDPSVDCSLTISC